jgi:ATP-binding cassette, subfamily B, bacterial
MVRWRSPANVNFFFPPLNLLSKPAFGARSNFCRAAQKVATNLGVTLDELGEAGALSSSMDRQAANGADALNTLLQADGTDPLPPGKSLKDRLEALKDLGPYIALVWRSSPTLTMASLGLRLIRALMPIAILYVGKLIIDEVVAAVAMPDRPDTMQGWFESGRLNYIMMLAAIEFALAVTADVMGRVVSLIDGLLSERLSNTASIQLMTHAATLDLESFEDADFQDQLDRARHQTSAGMTLMMQLFDQAQDFVTVVSFGAGLIFYAPWVIVLLIIALMPAFLGEAHFNERGYALDFQRTAHRREMDYIRQTASSVESAKEVKIFNLSGFLIDRYMKLARGFYAAHRHLAYKRAAWGSLFSSIGTAGNYAAYAYIIWRTLAGELSVGDLTFLAASFQRLRILLEGMLAQFSSTAGQALYLKDLFSFFDVKPLISSPTNPKPFPNPIREGFVFEDVGFVYPGTQRWAMRHLNFMLKAGEVVALVGENGAGKTTLVKLLTRLYDPTEGRILLDGIDLREYDLKELRGNVGIIFQDFVRFHVTVAENIAVGRINERRDRERIIDSAMRAQAEELIEKLPRGYDQMIGKRFRGGVDLSGGEWQKIAIARAYMRQAQVLVLDEPTAALDARSEFEVFQRFKDLSDGKTALLISHRFSSVRMADRILVLADGQIEAAGTHDELIVRSSRYAELFELQAAGYR